MKAINKHTEAQIHTDTCFANTRQVQFQFQSRILCCKSGILAILYKSMIWKTSKNLLT